MPRVRLTSLDIPAVCQNFDSEPHTFNTHVRRVMTLETCRCQTRLDLRRVAGDGREDVTARDDSEAWDVRVMHV